MLHCACLLVLGSSVSVPCVHRFHVDKIPSQSHLFSRFGSGVTNLPFQKNSVVVYIDGSRIRVFPVYVDFMPFIQCHCRFSKVTDWPARSRSPPPHWVVDKRQALNGILSPVSVHILWVWMASLTCDWLMTKAFLAHDTCGM